MSFDQEGRNKAISDTGGQALEGIKVADFSWVVAAPLITKCLADHGALVVRIESNARPCLLRTSAPFKDGRSGVNRSGFYATYNTNKYSITLDLGHSKGMEVAKRLVSWADIVAENFLPGTMERMGLGYDDLRKIKPDIIMLRASMQGQTGPRAVHPGFGTQLSALAGLSHILGWPDREPATVYGAYTDFILPRFGVAALVAALAYRRKTGIGQCIDLSQYECTISMLTPMILDFALNNRIANRAGNHCQYAAPHGVYRCKGNDEWCAITVFTDQQWGAFCKIAGNSGWTRDPRFATLMSRKSNEDELDRLIEQWTVNFTAVEVMTSMQAAGIAAGVVRNAEGVHNDPQLKHRHHFRNLDHPEMGIFPFESVSFRLSRTPSKMRLPSPCLGEHSEYVCTQLLGMSDQEFVELVGAGAFG